MTRDEVDKLYDESLLMYLYQTPSAINFAAHIDITMFFEPVHQVLWSLYDSYIKRFKVPPTEIGLCYIVSQELKDESDYYLALISQMYRPIKVPEKQVLESIIIWCKRRAAMNIIETLGPKLLDGDESVLDQFYAKTAKMNAIGDTAEQYYAPIHILNDPFDIDVANYDAYHTHLPGLDALTNAKGFYSPQLNVWMAGPKGFKTGSLLNLAMSFVGQGLKGIYFDTENGTASLRRRFYQHIARQSYEDLTIERLSRNASILKLKHGDIRIEYLPAKVATMDDAEVRIKQAISEGFIPNFFIWDYLDNIKPLKEREKRLGIQEVYFHAIYFNVKYNTFSWTPSQVGRGALEKPVFTMEDLAEDFGKAANAHSAWALCRTPKEADVNVGRVVPVFQREGVRLNSNGTNCVFVHVDEATQQVRQITVDEYKEYLSNAE